MKRDHRPLAAAPSLSNTTLRKNTHRQRKGCGGGGRGSGTACEGFPAPLASSSPVANGCRKGSCKDEEGEDKSQESPLHILLCREGGGVVVLMEAAPIAEWEGGGRVSTPFLPPLFLVFPLPLSLVRSSRLPPSSGAGRGADPTAGAGGGGEEAGPSRPLCLPSPFPGGRGRWQGGGCLSQLPLTHGRCGPR